MSTVPDDRLAEPVLVTLDVVAAFAPLGIRYAVGGSLASSLHGKPRSTDDVDLVAELALPHVAPLVAAWSDAYYVDAEMIRDAIRRRSCFNIIHLATMLKVDIFVAGNDLLVREELGRARGYRVSDDPPRELVLASAEDIVLQKLHWYRLGGGVSERQWRDVLGVLAVRAGQLDTSYLRQWASHLVPRHREFDRLAQRRWGGPPRPPCPHMERRWRRTASTERSSTSTAVATC